MEEYLNNEFPWADSSKSFLMLDEGITSGIYRISNNLNKKVYIGSSKDILRRWDSHMKTLIKGNHSCRHLQNFFNKHNDIMFTFEILEECDERILFEREQYYLDTLDPFDLNGFNIAKIAGLPNFAVTEKEKLKLSEDRTIGFLQYDVSGKFIKRWDSAKILSLEMKTPRQSFNKACNNRLKTLKGFIWRYDDGKNPEQLSEDFMKKIVLKPQKKIFAYSCEGELIAEFKNSIDCQNKTGFYRKQIKKVCARTNNRYKNLFWVAE